MANKNMYYPVGFQDKVNRLMQILSIQGIDLRNTTHPEALSESKLFKYLVERELARYETKE